MSADATAAAPGSRLLATKFLPPLPGAGYVRRERLISRLGRSSPSSITLLSAPAGFGKTSLLAGWLSELDEPWAWLSIDSADNDPGRLWAHLIAAIQQLAGPVGEDALVELRRRGARVPVDDWLTSLINDLAAAPAAEGFLVLDDLHLLVDAEQRTNIGQFVSSLPTWLHVVISTRADPALPLPRLRAEGRVTDIREIDLRFDPAEARSLLETSGMERFDEGQVDLLVGRTEGWAAGLRLATIVLGADDAGTQLDDIVGSRRPFTDYLIAEVIDHQPERMRAFLYATSVVDRINPSLARAVSGDVDAARLLRDAERQGLFLMALDGNGEWYRYHHLFAQALRHELKVADPAAAQGANVAAARWFETQGEAATALEHWLAAEQPVEALRLAIDVTLALVDRGEASTVEGIVRRIPPSVPGDDPGRQLDYGLLISVYDPETFLEWVGQAAATLAGLEQPDPHVVTQYLGVRSAADLCVGAWDEAFDRATQAVERGSAQGRAAGYTQRARLQLVRAAGWLERLDTAETGFQAYLEDPRMPEAIRAMVAPAAWSLAAALGGRIDEAEQWATRAAAAGARGFHHMISSQEILLTQAMVARERAESDAAVQAIEMLRTVDFQVVLALKAVGEIELALIRLDQGRLDDAAAALDAAPRVRSGGELGPLVMGRLQAARSALCVAGGDPVGARHAAERMPLGLWRDVALARAALADGASSDAEALLRSLVPLTPRQLVVVQMLSALSVADRDPGAARDHTVAALQAAAAVGLYQTVIGAGPGASELIEKASWSVPASWVERTHAVLAASAGAPAARIPGLVEQLTRREFDAARYLPSRLTVPEIARELGVSPNTLKTHLKTLYRKLGVTSREDAISRSRALGILR